MSLCVDRFVAFMHAWWILCPLSRVSPRVGTVFPVFFVPCWMGSRRLLPRGLWGWCFACCCRSSSFSLPSAPSVSVARPPLPPPGFSPLLISPPLLYLRLFTLFSLRLLLRPPPPHLFSLLPSFCCRLSLLGSFLFLPLRVLPFLFPFLWRVPWLPPPLPQ